MSRINSIAIFSVLLFASSVQAGETLSASAADRLGLEIAWERNLQVPTGSQSIVHQELYVHNEAPLEYVEIVGASAQNPNAKQKVLFRLLTSRLGKDGKPIGKVEAQRLARNEIRRLKRRSINGTITTRIVPRVNLYSLGDDGTIECRNAETGEPIWMQRIGDRRLGYSKFGVNDRYISLINGANLIQLDVKNGEEIRAVRTNGAPLFGAVNSGRFALIPTIRNGVEGYSLDDIRDQPFHEIVEGHALSAPVKAPGTTRVGWGTSEGFVYVMELQGRPGVLFRLDVDGNVGGRLATSAGNRFYFGSDRGQVYCVRATRVGKVIWSKPYGEPFFNDPMVVGEQLLLRSGYGNLYSLGLADGVSTWQNTSPGVGELLAAFDGKIFVRSLSGNMAVLDLKTGEPIQSLRDILPNKLLVNSQSDRLYLVTTQGSVQCVRPAGAAIPTFNKTSEAPEMSKKMGETEAGPAMFDKPSMVDPFDAKSADPFAPAGGGDPFGADPGADPFGGGGAGAGADPFGGGGADAGASPFGDDPFGN